jgi:hypothetical protein
MNQDDIYEERIMDGKMWCRNGPNDQWRSMSYEIMMGRMILAERSLNKALEEMTKLRQQLHWR